MTRDARKLRSIVAVLRATVSCAFDSGTVIPAEISCTLAGRYAEASLDLDLEEYGINSD